MLAVEASAAMESDFIFAELQMPPTDGIEVTKQISARNKYLIFIFVAVHVEPSFEEDCTVAGDDGFGQNRSSSKPSRHHSGTRPSGDSSKHFPF